MVPLALFGYLMCNVLLAWAILHQPYISTPDKPYPHLCHKIRMNGYIRSFLNHNQKFSSPDCPTK